jgi:hypothetical protein
MAMDKTFRFGLQVSHAMLRLTEANKNTLKVRSQKLTQSQHIAKHGQARATRYTLAV